MREIEEICFPRAIQKLEEKVIKASELLGREISVGANEGVCLPDLTVTPEKPNYARAVAPVKVAGKFAGDLFVIVFKEGDGTGEFTDIYPEGTLKLSDDIPSDISPYSRHVSRMYPRPKPQLGEVCIPLVNTKVWSNGSATHYGGTDLRVSGIAEEDQPAITLIDWKRRASGAKVSVQACSDNPSFLTLGTDSFGRRVGDPHAVINPSDRIQVAGFIATTDPEWLDLLASFDPVNPYIG